MENFIGFLEVLVKWINILKEWKATMPHFLKIAL